MIISILKNLQKELAVFLICIAIATVIIIIFDSTWKTAYENKQSALTQLENSRDRYSTAVNQKKLMEQYENQFNKLVDKNIIGDENRLNWIDTLETITTQHKIPYLKYSINKREKLNLNSLKGAFPAIDIYVSEMKLEMQLLHEGDLYTVLNNLNNKAKGIFDVYSCSIARNHMNDNKSLLESSSDKNFASVCVLHWYSMQKKTAQNSQLSRKVANR